MILCSLCCLEKSHKLHAPLSKTMYHLLDISNFTPSSYVVPQYNKPIDNSFIFLNLITLSSSTHLNT